MLKPSAPGANKTWPGLLEPTSVSHSRSMKGTKGRGREAGELDCRFRSFGARNIPGKHVSFTKFKGNSVSFVFILSFTFHLGENPRFEASLFKLIRKTINEGSFHEVLMGGISVRGDPDGINLQSVHLWRCQVISGGLFSWKVNINKCSTCWRGQGTRDI